MGYLYNNKVIFTGSQEGLSKVTTLFQTMIENESKGNICQMPDFIESRDDYFLDIWQYEEYECGFNYATRRDNPNIEALRMIANYYNVGFVLEYSELNCKVYGKAIYDGQILKDYGLTKTDLQQITEDIDAGTCGFEGKNYWWYDEIVEILLERKITNNEQNLHK